MHIVTHPGKSHADDRLTVSLILAHFGQMAVFRREPYPIELEDAQVFVIDIGLQHQPILRNFDHHQFSINDDPACAMSLLIESGILGKETTRALEDQPWVEAIATVDSKGPSVFAELAGLPRFPYELESPAELALQWDFERETSPLYRGTLKEGRVNKWCLEILQHIGERIIERAKHEYKHLEKLLNGCQILEVNGLTGFLAHVDDRRINERYALEMSTPPLDFAVYPSIRGKGWRITRMTSKVPINLYKVVDDPRVEFAHKSGFTLSTKEKISMEECTDLVRKSLIEQEE